MGHRDKNKGRDGEGGRCASRHLEHEDDASADGAEGGPDCRNAGACDGAVQPAEAQRRQGEARDGDDLPNGEDAKVEQAGNRIRKGDQRIQGEQQPVAHGAGVDGSGLQVSHAVSSFHAHVDRWLTKQAHYPTRALFMRPSPLKTGRRLFGQADEQVKLRHYPFFHPLSARLSPV